VQRHDTCPAITIEYLQGTRPAVWVCQCACHSEPDQPEVPHG